MHDILIKNATIVLEDKIIRGDMAIANEKIVAIEPQIEEESIRTIDASGKTLLPGGVDAHTHFELQAGKFRAVDDFSYGTRAALAGGVTTIVDHPAFGEPGCRVNQIIDSYHQLAKGHSYVDYSFHGVIQGLYDNLVGDLTRLAEEGIASVKAYMTYDYRLTPAQIEELFRLAAAAGQLVTVHAEDHDMITSLREYLNNPMLSNPYYHALSRPNASESRAVEKLLQAAKAADNAPIYLAHISTKEALEVIEAARAAGQQNILVETCPQYLLLDSRCYLDKHHGLEYMMCPPLRGPVDMEAIWQGISSGAIQTVCTDHCAFSKRQKQAGINDFREAPCGIPGVETRLDLLHSEGVAKGRIDLCRLSALTATNPARIFGLYPQKGALRVGADADIVIYDTGRSHVLDVAGSHGKCDYSPYEGWRVMGGVEAVLLRGRIAYDKGQYYVASDYGQFLHRRMDGQALGAII